MEKETFSSRDVIAYANKTFINIELDYADNRNLATEFAPPGIPATYLVDAAGQVIGTQIGFMSPADYVGWLKRSLDVARKIAEIKPKLAENPELYADWADLLFKAGSYGPAKMVAEQGLGKAPSVKVRLTLRKIESEILLEPDNDESVAKGIEEILALDPDGKHGVRDDGLLLRAESLARREKLKEALETIEEAIKAFPTSDRMDGLLYYRARLTWATTGTADEAAAWLEKVVNDFPESVFRGGAEAALKDIRAEKK